MERSEARSRRSGSGERGLQKNNGAERSAEQEVGERRAGVTEKQWSGAKRGAGGRGAESGVTEIGWSVERLFRRSRSAHMLCVQCGHELRDSQ